MALTPFDDRPPDFSTLFPAPAGAPPAAPPFSPTAPMPTAPAAPPPPAAPQQVFRPLPQQQPAAPAAPGFGQTLMPLVASLLMGRGDPRVLGSGLAAYEKGRQDKLAAQEHEADRIARQQAEREKFYLDVQRDVAAIEDPVEYEQYMAAIGPMLDVRGINPGVFQFSNQRRQAKVQKDARELMKFWYDKFGADVVDGADFQNNTVSWEGKQVKVADIAQAAGGRVTNAQGQPVAPKRKLAAGEIPNTSDEQALARFAQEHGYDSFAAMPFALQTEARRKVADAARTSQPSLEQQYLDAIARGDTAGAAAIKKAANIRDNPPAEADGALVLTPAGLDMAARQYAQFGTLPAMGIGAGAAVARQKIINRAAEMFPGANPAVNRATLQSQASALSRLEQQRQAVEAYERTALRNLDVFMTQAKQVIDTGSPFLNAPVRSISDRFLGSPQMAAFNTARRIVVPEFGRILSNPNLVGVLSDSARTELDELLKGEATLPQLMEMARILKTDAANRRTSVTQQIQSLRSEMGIGVGAGAGTMPGAAAAPAAPLGDNPYRNRP